MHPCLLCSGSLCTCKNPFRQFWLATRRCWPFSTRPYIANLKSHRPEDPYPLLITQYTLKRLHNCFFSVNVFILFRLPPPESSDGNGGYLPVTARPASQPVSPPQDRSPAMLLNASYQSNIVQHLEGIMLYFTIRLFLSCPLHSMTTIHFSLIRNKVTLLLLHPSQHPSLYAQGVLASGAPAPR